MIGFIELVVNTPSSLNKTPGILKKYLNHLLMRIYRSSIYEGVCIYIYIALSFYKTSKHVQHIEERAKMVSSPRAQNGYIVSDVTHRYACAHTHFLFMPLPGPKPGLDIEESRQALYTFCSRICFQIGNTRRDTRVPKPSSRHAFPGDCLFQHLSRHKNHSLLLVNCFFI